MSEQSGNQQSAVADALASRLEAQQTAASGWARALRELGALDRAMYEAVADTPTPQLDAFFRRLSDAATYSRLWFGVAAAIAALGGPRGRQAAVEGVLAIGVTSATVNLGMKPLAQRPRPDPAGPALTGARRVRMPGSASFPSGHAASASAFAYAVGRTCRGLPCRSGCWRPRSLTRASTPACIIRATSSWAPLSAPAQRRRSARRSTVPEAAGAQTRRLIRSPGTSDGRSADASRRTERWRVPPVGDLAQAAMLRPDGSGRPPPRHIRRRRAPARPGPALRHAQPNAQPSALDGTVYHD